MTENVKILALRLLDRFNEHVSARLLLLQNNRDGRFLYLYSVRRPTGFTGLHGVAFLRALRIVSTVLERREWDADANDSMEMTALT